MATSDLVPSPPAWNDWRGGDWGALGSEEGQGYFRSVNCQVYEDGSLGTRPGYRNLELDGLAVNPLGVVWRGPDGSTNLGYIHLVTSDDMVHLIPVGLDDDELALGDTVSAAVTLADRPPYYAGLQYWDAPDAPEPPLHVSSISDGGIVTLNGTIYRDVLDGAAVAGGDRPQGYESITEESLGSLTDLGVTITELYGSRMFSAGNPDETQRGYWSQASDFTLPWNIPIAPTDDIDPNYGPVQFFTAGLATPSGVLSDSAIVGLKEVRNGLLIALADGSIERVSGVDPVVGLKAFLERIGAPAHPAAIVDVGSQVYYLPADTRGVVVASLQTVDVGSYGRLRVPDDAFTYAASLSATKRAAWAMRAIGEDHNNYVLLSAVKDWPDSERLSRDLYTTLEMVNGTWVVGEFKVAAAMDYATISGGHIARTYFDGDDTVLEVRDETLNRPARDTDVWSDVLSSESFGSDADSEVPNAGYGVLVLPEFLPRVGVNVGARQFAVEVDYWRSEGYDPPEFYLEVVTLTVGSRGQPIESLLTHRFGGTNFLSNVPVTSGDAPRRYRFDVSVDEVNYARGFQVGVKFRSCAIRSIVPRWDLATWLEFAQQSGRP